MSTAKFISEFIGYAINECNKRTKKVHPSVCVAQAALETGWGTSSLMKKANAYFGIKATQAWLDKGGKVYNSKTKEVYSGKTVSITASFRAYDSRADSVKDYYDLITTSSRYSGAVNASSAQKCIEAIKSGGYATDPDYVSKVMSIINANKLTTYDTCMNGSTSGSTNSSTSNSSTDKTTVKYGQNFLNALYNLSIAIDGSFGAESKKASVKALQTEYNKQYGAKLTVDGSYGPKTQAISSKHNLRKGASGNITRIMQICLIGHGYSVGSNGADGSYGSNTVEGLKKFQKAKGITADGILGVNTWKKLLS